MTTHLRAAAALALAALALGACGDAKPKADDGLLVNQQSSTPLPTLNPDPAQNTYAPALGVDLTKFTKRPSGLYVRDDKVGTGPEAASGKTVSVAYTGSLANGKVFDSSEGKDPITFPLGTGAVIDAWDEGVPGMRVGGVRTIVVPAALGYGTAGAGVDIPPNAVLVFRMELVRVQ
jgi:peptidylprolyl isomerase